MAFPWTTLHFSCGTGDDTMNVFVGDRRVFDAMSITARSRCHFIAIDNKDGTYIIWKDRLEGRSGLNIDLEALKDILRLYLGGS